MRGVPRERSAISAAPSRSMGIPRTSAEREIVHTRVQELGGLETSSEGAEPNRYVVITPAALEE